MDAITVFLDKLAGAGFEPHGHCYLWMPKLIFLHVLSDSVIALAYFSIPGLLIYFVRKRRDLPFTSLFLMFGLFIVSCGTTHLMSIYEIWHGAYWLSGAIKAVTAVSSIATAIMMIPLLPRALALRSPAELDRINRELSRTLGEKEQALDMYRREHNVATTLQEAWLPASLPHIPGLEFDAIYRPAAPEADIGGDWYDAFLLESGKLFITIGDVAGHGLAAAVMMGKLRQGFRVLALLTEDPSAILSKAHIALRLESEATMATALVAVYDPSTRVLTYATAGHPPPVLRDAEGLISTFASGQVPLGLGVSDVPVTHAVNVPSGGTIVFYTDGLIETQKNFSDGFANLKKAVDDPKFTNTAHPARFLIDTITCGSLLPDDVAVLVMRTGKPLHDLDLDLKAVPSNAHVVRQSLGIYLDNACLSPERLFGLQVAVGEAVMNVIEHAYTLMEGGLHVYAHDNHEVVVEISDQGEWRYGSPQDDRGRGFSIMKAFTDDMELTRTEEGSRIRLVMRKCA
jgi:anti-sigma regulatory factor (Ser/Thr protein kinase)